MIEHKQLLKFAKDGDDYPVMLYLAKVSAVIDWKDSSPEEVLYIPENLFESVGSSFIEKVGSEGYYGKSILDEQLIEILCGERESGEYSEGYISALSEIRKFVELGLRKKQSHYLAFEGP